MVRFEEERKYETDKERDLNRGERDVVLFKLELVPSGEE
jgi:hypothetical protein